MTGKVAKDRGWKAKLRRRIDRLRHVVYWRRTELILDGSIPPRSAKPGALQLYRIEPHHHAVLGELNPEDARKFSIYLRNGYQGFLAFVGERPIGHIWFVDNQVSPERAHPAIERYRLQLGAGDVYLFELLILPDARGHGVANTFLGSVLAELRAHGYRRAYGCVAPDNTPARWTYQVFRFETVDSHVSHRFLDLVLWDDGRLYVHPVLYALLHPAQRSRTFDFMPLFSTPAASRVAAR